MGYLTMNGTAFVALVLLVLAGCASDDAAFVPDMGEVSRIEVFVPEGDVEAGRAAFLEMRCEVCHSVAGSAGEGMPAPFAANPGPPLGQELSSRSRDQVASSIIVPSHIIDERAAEYTDGLVSPMGDFTHIMTVRQLMDIVAFLQSL
jgi:mono/diheme cytochrome c family protein